MEKTFDYKQLSRKETEILLDQNINQPKQFLETLNHFLWSLGYTSINRLVCKHISMNEEKVKDVYNNSTAAIN
jgi:hypothetical protein